MPRSEHKRQQKLAKKNKRANEVRKEIRKLKNPSALDTVLSAVKGAFSNCVVLTSSDGLTSLVVSRRAQNGTHVGVTFLVDQYCLGVKDFGLIRAFDIEGFSERRRHEGHNYQDVTPAHAAKLVAQAVDYAKSIGFPPHPDLAPLLHIFSGVDISTCETEFEFGKDGKPLYISSPYDDDAKRSLILHTLNNLGPDGFHFVEQEAERPDFYNAHSHCGPGCDHDHAHGPQTYLVSASLDDLPDDDMLDEWDDEQTIDAVDVQSISSK